MKRRYDPEREEVRAGRARFFEALQKGYSNEEAAELANSGEAGPIEDRRPKSGVRPHPPALKTGVEALDSPDTPVIPDNWQMLPWPARLKLAASVSPTTVSNSEDVTAAIEAEIARRKTMQT
jgi:hypothetical protein